jgi:hypothetical protein
MEPDRNDKADVRDSALFVVLAQINDHMIAIRNNLEENLAVATATRACDIRTYLDFRTEEEVRCFESYVEAKTHSGEIFCWSLDVTLTSLGWKFQRCVMRQTKDGEQLENEFANNCSALMNHFEESAKNFDFST